MCSSDLACVANHPRLCGQNAQARSAAAMPKCILPSTWGPHFIFYEIMKQMAFCNKQKRSRSTPAQTGKVMDFLVRKTPALSLGTCGRLSTPRNGPKRGDSFTKMHPWRHVACGSSFKVVLV